MAPAGATTQQAADLNSPTAGWRSMSQAGRQKPGHSLLPANSGLIGTVGSFQPQVAEPPVLGKLSAP